MTNDIQLYQTILRSWEICSEKVLPKELNKPIIKLGKDEFKAISLKKKLNFQNFLILCTDI